MSPPATRITYGSDRAGGRDSDSSEESREETAGSDGLDGDGETRVGELDGCGGGGSDEGSDDGGVGGGGESDTHIRCSWRWVGGEEGRASVDGWMDEDFERPIDCFL